MCIKLNTPNQRITLTIVRSVQSVSRQVIMRQTKEQNHNEREKKTAIDKKKERREREEKKKKTTVVEVPVLESKWVYDLHLQTFSFRTREPHEKFLFFLKNRLCFHSN